MKKMLLLAAIFPLAFVAVAQPGSWYVAAKAGLSIREKPSASAKVLDKIPYGEKLSTGYEGDSVVKISTEGFNGSWAKTTYKGKTGYVVNSYLLPVAAPKATVKTLKDYISQISSAAGAPVLVKKTLSEDMSTTLKKQLYKNGCEIHEFSGYEYNSETYFIPDLTIEQGFLLLRLLKAFPDAIGENDAYPLSNSKKTLKNGDKRITVEKQNWGSSEPVVEKIKIEWEDGANYELHIYMIDSQLVIFSSGGV